MKISITPANNLDSLQIQLTYPNTTYVLNHIQQTFGTESNPLVIPANSQIEFEGGMFIGGYVKLNGIIQFDTLHQTWNDVKFIVSKKENIYQGFFNEYIRPEWFGAVGDGLTDDWKALQQAFDISSKTSVTVLLSAKIYFSSQTLNVISGSVIKGRMSGSMDRNSQIGTTILFNSTEYNAAIDFSVEDDKFDIGDPSGGYTFILENFIVENKSIGAGIGIRFVSNASKGTAARKGLVCNIGINNFHTGILINAISYVKFNRVSLYNFLYGIKISRSNKFLEFAWFENVYLNNTMPNSIGIDIDSANNLYFTEIDVNDCNIGVNIHAVNDIFNMFFNRFNLTRCNIGLKLLAEKAYMTRLKFSEFTIWAHNYSVLIDRNNSFVMGEIVFSEIFDASPDGTIFVKNNAECLSWLYSICLNNIRTHNKIIGLKEVKRLDMFNISGYGSFIVPANLNKFEYIITDSSPIDYDPVLFAETNKNISGFDYHIENVQMGHLKIIVSFSDILRDNTEIKYFLPQFI